MREKKDGRLFLVPCQGESPANIRRQEQNLGNQKTILLSLTEGSG